MELAIDLAHQLVSTGRVRCDDREHWAPRFGLPSAHLLNFANYRIVPVRGSFIDTDYRSCFSSVLAPLYLDIRAFPHPAWDYIAPPANFRKGLSSCCHDMIVQAQSCDTKSAFLGFRARISGAHTQTNLYISFDSPIAYRYWGLEILLWGEFTWGCSAIWSWDFSSKIYSLFVLNGWVESLSFRRAFLFIEWVSPGPLELSR